MSLFRDHVMNGENETNERHKCQTKEYRSAFVFVLCKQTCYFFFFW